MRRYVMIVEYKRINFFDKTVTERENYTTTASNVQQAIENATEWCREKRKPYHNEILVSNIYSEEV